MSFDITPWATNRGTTVSTDSKYKRLHSLCETRWSERACGLKCFIESLTQIFDSLECLNSSEFNKDTSSQARTLLASISHFDFIITLLVTETVLSEINTLSRTLQSVEIDLNQAFDYVDTVLLRFKQYRSDAETFFSELYTHEYIIPKKMFHVLKSTVYVSNIALIQFLCS